MNCARSISAALGACVLAGFASAQTITVDITDADVIDVNPDTATIADLPGPDGHISFSEAMIASNNTPGRQTVGFAIPTSEWTYLPWYYPGRAVIHGMMFYANAYAEVTIDGTTQTAFTGDTNPAGHEVVILRGGGLYIAANDCRLTGLDNTAVFIEGSNCVAENNSVLGIEIYGGSGATVRGNIGGGNLKIDRSNNNVVVGSTFHRVRVLGWVDGGQPATNNRIGGPSLADRNFIMGQGTSNSQGIPGGYAVQLFDSIGTVIENNWIGTTPDGLSSGHMYTTIGISFESQNHDTVIRNNRIAGILAVARPPHAPAYFVGSAIQMYGSGSDVTIVGNKIGLNANDEPVLGSITGISTVHYYYPNGIQNVVIGGTGAGERNEIAGQLGTGISVANTYSGTRISGNSIHDNGGLGIDLVSSAFDYGVTLNDFGDTDTGGNHLQNFPVLHSATIGGQTTTITGVLDSAPGRTYTVEFFSSPACDPSGYGEGATYLGFSTVATDGAGHADVFAQVGAAAAGDAITATATEQSNGDTSEFSACIVATGDSCRADFDGDGFVTGLDFDLYVLAFEAGDATADFDADGFVTGIDFDQYVAAFEAGC